MRHLWLERFAVFGDQLLVVTELRGDRSICPSVNARFTGVIQRVIAEEGKMTLDWGDSRC